MLREIVLTALIGFGLMAPFIVMLKARCFAADGVDLRGLAFLIAYIVVAVREPIVANADEPRFLKPDLRGIGRTTRPPPLRLRFARSGWQILRLRPTWSRWNGRKGRVTRPMWSR
jgi:hypothetical protein